MGAHSAGPPKSEEVDLVDDEDRVVGSAPLSECLSRGLRHRAVAVLVLRSNGTVLLQRRSERDLWNPGLWTLSCTGHVKRGETFAQAAGRELSEELGLASPLRELWKILLPPFREGSLTEREWVTMYDTRTDSVAAPDPVELAEVKEVSLKELDRLIMGGPLTEDARILLRRYRDQA